MMMLPGASGHLKRRSQLVEIGVPVQFHKSSATMENCFTRYYMHCFSFTAVHWIRKAVSKECMRPLEDIT